LLWRRIGVLVQKSFLLTVLKTLAGCVVMAAVLIGVDPWLSAMPLWLYMLTGIGGAVVVYFAVLTILREPLVSELLQKVLKRRSTPAGGTQ
jgi:putative peptidoglycan lipid II flippase